MEAFVSAAIERFSVALPVLAEFAGESTVFGALVISVKAMLGVVLPLSTICGALLVVSEVLAWSEQTKRVKRTSSFFIAGLFGDG